MSPTGAPARRRRGDELEDALLAAAWAELQAGGYAALTYDAVAARAGTSKPVLYRRWPSKADLVVAAMHHAGLFARRELPDTGTLRSDVLESLRNFNDSRADFITAISVYLANIASDTGLSPAELRDRLLGSRPSGGQVFLDRAVQRGEIPDRERPPGLVTLPFDLFRHDLLLTLARVPEERILEIVDDLWLPADPLSTSLRGEGRLPQVDPVALGGVRRRGGACPPRRSAPAPRPAGRAAGGLRRARRATRAARSRGTASPCRPRGRRRARRSRRRRRRSSPARAGSCATTG